MHPHEFLSTAMRMAVDYLLTIAPMKDLQDETQLRDFLGGGIEGASAANAIMKPNFLIPADMAKINRAMSLQMGLALRFPNGETFIFFPNQEEQPPQAQEKNNVQTNFSGYPGYENIPFTI